MRKFLLLLLLLVPALAAAKTFVESKIPSFSITINQDTPTGIIQILVTTTTFTTDNIVVRDVSNERLPMLSISLAARDACRQCYATVYDSFSGTNAIPTPKVTSTP